MRHTGVTLMLEKGISARAIQFLAGWTSLRMLERYGHVRDSEVRRAVTANADHLSNVATKKATDQKIAASKSEK
jgi:site-specific recombinase XerD